MSACSDWCISHPACLVCEFELFKATFCHQHIGWELAEADICGDVQCFYMMNYIYIYYIMSSHQKSTVHICTNTAHTGKKSYNLFTFAFSGALVDTKTKSGAFILIVAWQK